MATRWFLLVIIAVLTMTTTSLGTSSSAVPDITMVYEVEQKFPGKVEAFCVTGDFGLDIEVIKVPFRRRLPAIISAPRKKSLSWKGTRRSARGVVCKAPGEGHHNVSAPLLVEGAKYVPEHLSVTVNKDEELRVNFTKIENKAVFWQKEPVKKKGWEKTELTDDNQLVIPANNLSGSGLYSVVPHTTAINPGSNDDSFGTFSVLVRECPAERYGGDCSEWCHDCMYGGVCDTVTGQCVCPPGFTGQLCHSRCPDNKIGQNCDIDLPDVRGKQICLPMPLGCDCAPGYKGPRCDQDCPEKKWGPGCRQTCHHCLDGCVARTGLCKSGRRTDCTEGDEGLPRLRRPPEVSDITPESAVITFQAWSETYDDGQLSRDDTLSYLIRLWLKEEGIQGSTTQPAEPSHRVSLTQLQAGSEYNIQVLVQVQHSSGKVCTADGNGRERVHTKKFTTPCPPEPPTPTRIKVAEKTSSSITLTWEDIVYQEKCNISYVLQVKDNAQAEDEPKVTDEAKYTASNLKQYTDYLITVSSVYQSQGKHSTTSEELAVKTLPEKPSKPTLNVVGKLDSFEAEWSSPPSDMGDLQYSYRYKTTLRACPDTDEFKFNEWSEWSSSKTVNIPVPPYSEVDMRLKVKNEAGNGPSANNQITIKPAIPDNKVENLICPENPAKECKATLENNCHLDHGPNLHVQYFLEVHNMSLRRLDGGRTIASSYNGPVDGDFTIVLPEDLVPYIEYDLTVYPANDAGRNEDESFIKRTSFVSYPAEPGKVTGLRVLEASNSLTVKWDKPDDDPPRGQLDQFRVSWQRQGTYYSFPSYVKYDWNHKIVKGHERSATISDLKYDIEYLVKVEAKNLDVEDFGPPEERLAKTRQGKPSPVLNLSDRNSTTNNIVIAWQEPEQPAGNLQLYVISANLTTPIRGQQPIIKNLSSTSTTFEFVGLEAGEEYQVTVTACNEQQCSEGETKKFWTKPKKPQLNTGIQWISASFSTITIQLPSSAFLPIEQWVVVTKIMTEEEGSLEKEDFVKGQVLQLIKNVDKGDLSLHGNSTKRRLGDSQWIAARLKVVQKKPTDFVVGDNQMHGGYHNSPLEANGNYWLAVVSETIAGPHREFSTSKPVLYQASPPTGYGVYVGVAVAVLILTAGILWLWRSCKKPSTGDKSSLQDTHLPQNGIENSSADVLLQPLEVPPVAVIRLGDTDESHQQFNVTTGAAASASQGHQELLPLPRQDQQLPPPIQIKPDYADSSKKIPISQVEEYLLRAIHSHDTEIEFRSVPTYMDMTCNDGQTEANKRKNRYRNNLPYDDTRVRLPLIPGEPDSDYINASCIQSHSWPDAYIATQGPKDYNKDTIGDFWRMVWHTGSHTLVMVANLIENGKVKVAQYWPDEGQHFVKYGLEIKHISKEIKMDFIIRKFLIASNGEQRLVKQYQYTAWPDHGVPQNPYGLAQMIKHLTQEPAQGPITVHCSAGIGRTGTIILVLYELDQLKNSEYLDPHEALQQLRYGRPRLVENTIQYVFGHKLLLEVLTGVQTSFPCSVFPKELEGLRVPQPPTNTTIIHQQYQKLKSLPVDLTYRLGSQPACAHLNRCADILPADSKMVFLQNVDGGIEGQYINAIRVNAMDHKDAYLAGEHPQEHTVKDAWRMVYEKKVAAWVLLQELPHQHPDYPSVLPSEEPQTVGRLTLTLVGQFQYKNFTEYYIDITVPNSHMSPPHKCVVMMMRGWPYTDLLPVYPEPLLAVMERVDSLVKGQTCSLFTCKDGVTGCGLMMALLQVVERLKLVQEVDVYRSVLSVIFDRPQFIPHVDQYDFLHTAAVEYLEALNQYGNFN